MSTTTRTSFYYDPSRQGYDTALWTTLAGTVVSGVYLIPDTDSSDVDLDAPYETISVAESLTMLLLGLPSLLTEAVGITDVPTVVHDENHLSNSGEFDSFTVAEDVAIAVA